MGCRAFVITAATATALATSVTLWIASPGKEELDLPAPLEAWNGRSESADRKYNRDLAALTAGFQAQTYRSFCGPASIATVLGAYGVKQADQSRLFPSLRSRLDTFYTGMSLAELAVLASSVGLKSEIAYADTLDLGTFRDRLKENLDRPGDFVVINYDRRVLKQAGAGHISPVAAYDETRDVFLVLDEAAYRYPHTWVPASLLYQAVHTRADDRFRGVLFISSYRSPE